MKRPTFLLLVLALLLASSPAPAKKKEKHVLPDFVLKAQTVVVVIQPDAAEPLIDPQANRKAQEEVEKALMRWGRFRLAIDTSTADLVITVRKGTGKVANPTISGGPIDTRPGTMETTDNQIRIGASKGRPPDASQNNDPIAQDNRTHTGAELGATDDSFQVFQGQLQYPLDAPPVWILTAKNALRPPDVTAVQEFRKAIEEAELAAKKKQPQQPGSPQAQPPAQKNP